MLAKAPREAQCKYVLYKHMSTRITAPCLGPFPHRSAGLFHGHHRWSHTCLWVSRALSSDRCPHEGCSAGCRPLWLSVKEKCRVFFLYFSVAAVTVILNRLHLEKVKEFLHQAPMKPQHKPKDFPQRCWSEAPWQRRLQFLKKPKKKTKPKQQKMKKQIQTSSDCSVQITSQNIRYIKYFCVIKSILYKNEFMLNSLSSWC